MSAPSDQNGDGGFNNPQKRPLEHSPTQAQQPGTSSLFTNSNPPYPQQQQGARTIYSNKPGGAFGAPLNGSTPAADGFGGGQDDFANGLYAGQRTTGMGRQPSNGGSPTLMQGANPMSPQDQPRKRLRRGGPNPADEGGEEGPGSFTTNLQSRLADVHVESGPPSTASSAYGGSASASMAPTPSWQGSMSGEQMQQAQQQHPAQSQQHPAAAPPSQPPFTHPGTPPLRASTGTPSAVAALANDPAFQAFRQQAGGNFPPEKVFAAWQQAGGDRLRAFQFLVDAKPATPPVGGAFNPNASYGAAGGAAPPGPGTPGQQYAPAPQQAQAAQPYPYAAQPGAPGQSDQQRPTISVVRTAVPAGYPPQQQQPGMQQHVNNGRPVMVPAGYAAQQQAQQPGAAPFPGYAAQPRPAGVPPQQFAPGQFPQLTPQQQNMALYQQQLRQAGFPPGAFVPFQQSQVFPPASQGDAGMTAAHISHYFQLQEGFKRRSLSPEEHKTLLQYVNVLEKHMRDQIARRAQAAGGGAGGAQGYYPGAGGPAGQFQPGAYAPNTVYAAAGPGGARFHPGQGYPHPQQQQRQQAPPPKPQAPKHAAPLTSGTILARQLAAAGGFGSAKKKPTAKKKAYNSDSDDDGGDYDSAGSGDEYGSRETPAQLAKKENIATEFFNECTRENLMELAGCNATQATLTMKLRPFASANDFRTRTRKQKGVGNNMMDTYLEVIAGMSEVDKVLNECEQIGRELSTVMQIWASGAAASSTSDATRPGATMANDVGLDLVAISEETIATRVDTSQDPRVRDAFKDYIRSQPKGVPDNIKLKDYQMLGVNWLNLLYRRGTSCILADEMGLGKTAQVIALLAHLKATDPKEGPHLVIVPSSTLDNWMREFSVFAPDLNVQSYYGSQGERYELRSDLRRMEDLDVVVTTYNIATGSPDDQKFLKRKMDFKVCVFDEGHQLKNSDSKKYKDLMQVRAKWRLLLTGTPLQNNLQELVSLLSFILPEQFRDANESLRAIFKVGPGQQNNLLSRERINRAKKMMTPFVLRRKKAQVLKDLPSKFERIEFCEMTEMQREVYDEAVQRSRKALGGMKEEDIEQYEEDEEDEGVEAPVDEDGKPIKKRAPKKKVAPSTKMGNKANTTSSAHVLTDLRKASNHPMLFRRLYDEKKLRAMSRDCLREEEFLDRNKDLIFEDMEVMTDFELHRFCQGYKNLEKYCLQNDEWMSAGKIAKLQELLPTMQTKGDRVLIFSQFVQVLDILEVVLDTMNIKYLKLTGQTQVADRQGLVDAFNQNEDITVFLLSTRAGGLGLNLTAANTVVFYDCDPHNDKQAEDRAYRIGQTRDVNIIRLVTKNSLDEAMLELANAKLKLDSEVSGGAAPAAQVNADGSTQEGADDGSAEKRMKKSLLSNLKKQFEIQDSQTSPVKTDDAAPKVGAA
ncbi:hypothetical protein JCM8547_004353 [Rhodosporidiobolus lusitaniae]